MGKFHESNRLVQRRWGRCLTGEAMGLKLMIWARDLLEVMFFVGIIGCTSTVVISWISILKSAFSDKNED